MRRNGAVAQSSSSVVGIVTGFAAGFFAVVVFHQAALGILHALGLTPGTPFSFNRTAPLGVPVLWSLAFWGGIWGIVFVWCENRFPRDAGYWAAALLFGAIGPTFVAWFIVAPLKGLPMAAGWNPSSMVIGPVVNGAWGIGTGIFLWLARRWR